MPVSKPINSTQALKLWRKGHEQLEKIKSKKRQTLSDIKKSRELLFRVQRVIYCIIEEGLQAMNLDDVTRKNLDADIEHHRQTVESLDRGY
jgi:hypothetical protein